MVWKLFRSALARGLTLAGPVAFLATVLYWALSLVLGFAFIYEIRLPQGFAFSSGLNPATYDSFAGAIDISLSSLMTLSNGLYAKSHWLQILMGTESVLGFALLTASVSWILSIYPVIEHRRSAARQGTLVYNSESRSVANTAQIDDVGIQQLLASFLLQITTLQNELTQFPITYYFYEQDKETALAAILPYLSELAEQNVGRGGAAGLVAASLGTAISGYLKLVTRGFLKRDFESREEALKAYAADQMREVLRSPPPRLSTGNMPQLSIRR